MNIVILSGKGNGKTTISTNLALLMKVNYIDCDVEEPNGFIFLKPEEKSKRCPNRSACYRPKKCTLCGACVKTCKFNALAKGRIESYYLTNYVIVVEPVDWSVLQKLSHTGKGQQV